MAFCFVLFVCFCLSVTHSNNKVCERHFVMNTLEFENDLGIVEKEMFVVLLFVHPRSTLSLQC